MRTQCIMHFKVNDSNCNRNAINFQGLTATRDFLFFVFYENYKHFTVAFVRRGYPFELERFPLTLMTTPT